MFIGTIFFFVIHFHLIIATPQINLYFTDQINENNNIIQHDCFRVTPSHDQSNIIRQIISYCVTGSLSKNILQKNNHFKKFTFAELFKQNITSQQLYLWSAPIDLIENYQFYLNQLSISNISSLDTKLFYNCTFPRFGSICQYEFIYYHSNQTSLNEIIHDFYRYHEYIPINMTCYIHLECDRGPISSCLDWSEICDGKIDCRNNNIDEEHCWKLEINECKDNEYRCANGQCIPKSFYQDGFYSPDCLDQSDEYNTEFKIYLGCENNEPIFRCEDIICTDRSLTSSCAQQREKLLIDALYSMKDNSISDDCWFAFKNIMNISNKRNILCHDHCRNEIYVNIIEKTCPDLIFIPGIPVLFNDIYFAYTKNDSRDSNCTALLYPYKCYNHSRYDEFFIDSSKIIFKNTTCYRSIDETFESQCIRFSWVDEYVKPIFIALKKYNLFSTYTPTICNRLNMYQCNNSPKCISIYRLIDGINDCPYNDDEDIMKINHSYAIEYIKRNHYKCETSNKYIPQSFIIDGKCDCQSIEYEWCEDENEDLRYVKKHISFQTICDGFTELLPIIIDGRNETDETECEYWLCNNIYTHCNGIWNCYNGEDELDCPYTWSSLNCRADEHVCVSSDTNQLLCLPLTKRNDGNVDCIGAIDEPYLCYRNDVTTHFENFYCTNDTDRSCMSGFYLCDGIQGCFNGDDERFCNQTRTLPTYDSVCDIKYLSIRSDVEHLLCETFDYRPKERIVYFSLNTTNILVEDQINNTKNINILSSLKMKNSEQESYCHRGFPLRSLIDKESTICFCPPSFYGDRCEYQNERISLSIQFRTSSNSWETLFNIIILLIDDSDKRIIHSYEKFTYLSIRDCEIKFNIYLLYSTRPKNLTKQYSIHIDIYEKVSLNYRGSLLMPIKFPFLPVYRLSFIIDIPQDNNIYSCLNNLCNHGKCIKYFNNSDDSIFCQCNQGWSGQYCTIPYECTCSLNSLCIGITNQNKSICVCPLYRFGPRCLLIDTICSNSMCMNGGECIPNDEYIENENEDKYTCICPKGYMGKQCEIIENKIILSFEKNINLPQSIFIHFIEIIKYNQPRRTTTFRSIPFKRDSIIIHWPQPFHLVFIEFPNKNYYLTIIQKYFYESIIINKTINQFDHCQNINEIFNKTIIKMHLIRRIKYYQLICQSNISCFYDNIHLCLCQSLKKERVANCFEFNHNMKFDCLGQSVCENGAQCFQDSLTCSKRSMCICPPCFYGTLCQFSTNQFGLSLDAILGYYIQPTINIIEQPIIVKISIILTIIFIILGFLNGICALITFKRKLVCEVGCGLYLLTCSINTLLITILFGFKFLILILTQIGFNINRSFLIVQCHSIDFLLLCCLNMDQWLNTCVAIERAITTIQSTHFNKKKSKKIAKIIIFILIIFVIVTNIHDPIYRNLIDEENEDEIRIWCIVSYTSRLQTYNSIMNIFHFITPCIFNLISSIILFTKKTHHQSNAQTDRTYRQIFFQHIRQHKSLFVAPFVLVIFAIPRLIISFVSKCMELSNDSWLFLIGYFISFISPMLTFLIFILPSKFYMKEYRRSMNQYRRNILRKWYYISDRLKSVRLNRIHPM